MRRLLPKQIRGSFRSLGQRLLPVQHRIRRLTAGKRLLLLMRRRGFLWQCCKFRVLVQSQLGACRRHLKQRAASRQKRHRKKTSVKQRLKAAVRWNPRATESMGLAAMFRAVGVRVIQTQQQTETCIGSTGSERENTFLNAVRTESWSPTVITDACCQLVALKRFDGTSLTVFTVQSGCLMYLLYDPQSAT
jgi:hypothetical protein